MRIIGGRHKGRKLKSPPGEETRPTADKIRGAIFNCLQDVSGCTVLDLFGGSGAMALEALSRGAAEAVIVEEKRAAHQVIKTNLALCGVEERATLRLGDFRTFLAVAAHPFDLIFLDPPYGAGLAYEAMTVIARRQLLRREGIIVVETGGQDAELTAPTGFRCVKEKRYGDTIVLFYRLDL